MKTFSVFFVVGLFLVVVAFAKDDEKKIPKFLEEADEKAIKEFEDILSKFGDLTDKEVDDAVEKWVSEQSDDIKEKYVAFKDELKKYIENAETAHKASVKKFSADAKAADEKLSAIANNPAFSAKEKGQKLEEIISKLPKNVQEEIEKAMNEED